jgi:2-(1,2-epoxy-1,2-dihydrophenyl)acetyl-CoA isomerase
LESPLSWPSCEGLRVEVRDEVLVVTFDRPERANALAVPQVQALLTIVRQQAAGEGPRALLLRATGRHFCAGADLSGNRGTGGKPVTGHMVRSLAAGPHALVAALWDCPVPVVAAVKGRTVGLGLHIALTADVVVAAASASFSEPFGDRGFSVDSGGSWLLPRRVGLTRASALVLAGAVIDAPTAEAWGIVTEIQADDDLDDEAWAAACRLARGPTLALSQSKRLLRRHLSTELGAALAEEALAVELCLRSDDFKEGMRAFVEKRAPEFRGR